jgi:hypothetical protein
MTAAFGKSKSSGLTRRMVLARLANILNPLNPVDFDLCLESLRLMHIHLNIYIDWTLQDLQP